jgi:hypothetical protein
MKWTDIYGRHRHRIPDTNSMMFVSLRGRHGRLRSIVMSVSIEKIGLRRLGAVLIVAAFVATSVFLVPPPTAGAIGGVSSKVPGRFCKNADAGKRLKTAKYGTLICKKDGDRLRWKRS